MSASPEAAAPRSGLVGDGPDGRGPPRSRSSAFGVRNNSVWPVEPQGSLRQFIVRGSQPGELAPANLRDDPGGMVAVGRTHRRQPRFAPHSHDAGLPCAAHAGQVYRRTGH